MTKEEILKIIYQEITELQEYTWTRQSHTYISFKRGILHGRIGTLLFLDLITDIEYDKIHEEITTKLDHTKPPINE